jgi:hypothetical protein
VTRTLAYYICNAVKSFIAQAHRAVKKVFWFVNLKKKLTPGEEKKSFFCVLFQITSAVILGSTEFGRKTFG